MKTLSLMILTIIVALSARLEAGDCCHECGCQQNVHKICRVVCDVKKEVHPEYSCECEDFCIPGKSTKCGEQWVKDCRDCDGGHCEPIWKPSCGCVRTRKFLVKRDIEVEKKIYKCEVHTICGGCGCAQLDPIATQHIAGLDPAKFQDGQILPASAFEPIADIQTAAHPTAGLELAEEPAKLSWLERLFSRNTK